MPAEGTMSAFMDGYPGDEDVDKLFYPDTVPRRCGDTPCLGVFTFGLILMAIITGFSAKNGRLDRYEGLTDYNGKFCGVSDSVVNKPYLYFCREGAAGDLFRRDRICVERCDVGSRECPGGTASQPYAAIRYAGLLCLPADLHLREELDDFFLADPDVGLFMTGIAFSRAWPAIFLSAVISIVLSFLFVCVVSRCKKPLVFMGLAFIIISGLLCGTYLMMNATTGGADGLSHTGDERVGTAVGALLIVLSICVLCVSIQYANNINLSIACIRAGAECIWDSPSIVFEPFIHLAFKLTVLIGILIGLLRLLTWMQYDEKYYTGSDISIRVRLNYTPLNVICISFYLFMSVWIMEVLNGISTFTVAYASQLWYFAPLDKELMTKEVPVYATCKGLAVALSFHMGTIIYGSFCSMIFRIPRMFLAFIAFSQYQLRDEAAYSVRSSCCCCFNIYDGFVKYMTPWAYMDVALNASRYCKASYFTVSLMETPDVKYLTMHTATWMVQFVGHVFVSFIGGLHTYLACRTGYVMGEMGMHASHEAPSTFYVPRPSVMGILAFLVCWGVAHPFLMLPGNISDNILFCYSVERKRWVNAPVTTTYETGVISRFIPCAGRQTQQHIAASARAQPPATAAFLTEARSDYGREE